MKQSEKVQHCANRNKCGDGFGGTIWEIEHFVCLGNLCIDYSKEHKTLANSVSGHTAQTCSGETPNNHTVYGASSDPGSGIKPEDLAEVHQGASVSNQDCKTCYPNRPARGKCDDLKVGT